MANEFKHANVGAELTASEWETANLHQCNNQATGDLLYAANNAAFERLPVGSNNQVLVVSGGLPGWSECPSGGRLLGFQVFTSGSGTYTKNASATRILVEGIGGGGGGGGVNCNNAGAGCGGGGSGAYFRRFITSPNDTYGYVVGAGGGGGANTGASGNVGANTTFDAAGAQNLVAPGGAGGAGWNQTNNSSVKFAAGGAGGAVATGNNSIAGDVFGQGDYGDMGFSGSRTSSMGGGGGTSALGGGGTGGAANGANTSGNGANCVGPGAGGGGGAASANGNTIRNAVGGSGSNGIIIVWEFS